MRGLFLAGLSLALGCLVAHSSAEEIQWRPAGQAPAANQGTANPFLPTSYQQTEAGLDPVFRAKHDVIKVQPLPEGPPLPNGPDLGINGQKENAPSEVQKPEQIPMPKPMPSAGPGPAKGIIVNAPGTIIYEGAVPPGSPLVPNPGGPCWDIAACPDTCCEPDWSCGPGNNWQGRHCFSSCYSCYDPCAMPNFYARGEYLLWTMSNYRLPPLVTATTLTPQQLIALGADPAFRPGALGQPGTMLVFGGDKEDSPTFSGGRFTVGFGNVFRHHNVGIEATYFFLGERGRRLFARSDPSGQPGLYSPFFGPAGNPEALFIAFPTLLQGNVLVEHNSRLWGIEANLRKPLICDCNHKLDLLAGFRFIELNENLTITRNIQCIPEECIFVTGVLTDHFGTRNRFYGGQIGLDYEYRHCNWIFGVTGKVALGSMYQTVSVDGSLVAAPGANVPSAPVGLLAQPTNIGRHQRDRFAVVPELGLKVGYQFTENVSGYVGYSFVYLSDVVRPGDQVDLVIDPSGKLRRPGVPFRNTDFWAYGLNFGLECRY